MGEPAQFTRPSAPSEYVCLSPVEVTEKEINYLLPEDETPQSDDLSSGNKAREDLRNGGKVEIYRPICYPFLKVQNTA